MANFRDVNKAVSKRFPDLDIEVVRGDGYVYFAGNGKYHEIDSIYTNPTTTSTEDVTRMAIESIEYWQKENGGDL